MTRATDRPANRRSSRALPRTGEKGPGGEGRMRRVRTGFRLLAAAFLALLCVSGVHTVRADGEAGVVIEEEGQVRTYCVPFSGDSIAGDDLLDAAGLTYEDVGTGAGAVLCAIEEVGCFDASSFNTCWCECQGSGGSDCVYWAFFTRDYGEGWVYSARAFDRIDATDGDLHAWKWGEGGPSSAPRPADSITFESVCGHAPRGGAPPPSAATSTPPPTSTPAQTQPPGGSPTSSTETPFSTVPATSSTSPEVSVTFSPQPTNTAAPQPPATARGDDGGGGSPTAFIAFGAVAVALVAAIGAAAYWRRSHGT